MLYGNSRMSPGQDLLDQLLSEDLSGITFVRDYLQLQFNPPPTLNVYTACRVVAGDEAAAFGEPTFANLIIAQIGKDVASVGQVEDAIVIGFEDGSRIEVPLGGGSLVGPEACVMFGSDGSCRAWP